MNVLDLFSGIGGFSLGLERAGMQTVAFCEIDPFCRAVLEKRWPNVPVFEDVRKLTAGDVGDVDVICGGFPCQDISAAGKKIGITGARSGLWSEYARLIGEIRPRFAIVENVAALLNRGIDRVLGDLAEIRFHACWHCIPASAVGARHQRDRVWIIAYSDSEGRRFQQIQEQRRESQTDIADDGEKTSVANPTGERFREAGEYSERPAKRTAGGGGVLADSGSAGLSIAITRGLQQELSEFAGNGWWFTEPDVGRVADGVPARAHRLRSLGNAVVPQIPEIIGRAIMTHNQRMAA